jgi:hypothetical protein
MGIIDFIRFFRMIGLSNFYCNRCAKKQYSVLSYFYIVGEVKKHHEKT